MPSINEEIDQSVFVRIAEELFKWDFKKKSKESYIMLIVDFFFDKEQKLEFNELMNDFENKWLKPFDWWEQQINDVYRGYQKPISTIIVRKEKRGLIIREKKKIDYRELQDDIRYCISWCRTQLKKALARQNIDFANYTKEDLKNAITIN